MAGSKPAAAQVKLLPTTSPLRHFESPQLCVPTNAFLPHWIMALLDFFHPLPAALIYRAPSESPSIHQWPEPGLGYKCHIIPVEKRDHREEGWEAEPSIARWWCFLRTPKASCQADFLDFFCNLLWVLQIDPHYFFWNILCVWTHIGYVCTQRYV